MTTQNLETTTTTTTTTFAHEEAQQLLLEKVGSTVEVVDQDGITYFACSRHRDGNEGISEVLDFLSQVWRERGGRDEDPAIRDFFCEVLMTSEDLDNLDDEAMKQEEIEEWIFWWQKA